MKLRGVFTRARADEKPAPAAEGLRAGGQRDAVFALALLAATPVRRCPMETDVAGRVAEAGFKADGRHFLSGADASPAECAIDGGIRFQPSRLLRRRGR